MPVTEPTPDLGCCGGPIELLLPPRAASERGEMDQDQNEMGDFQWTALPFGLHCSPYWTGRLAQIVEKTLRRQGFHLI